MKTSERFTNAVTKLYNAFHNGELDSNDCTMCAVGNICDNNSSWTDAGCFYVGKSQYMTTERIDKANLLINSTGYKKTHLSKIESIFIKNVGMRQIDQTKENHFKGLCAVVEYLCELEGIPNVMDYSKLFETENNEPKYKLENVLV